MITRWATFLLQTTPESRREQFTKQTEDISSFRQKNLLSYPQTWEALKRVLKTGQIYIENLKDIYGLFITPSLKPEPIPVDLKVILIGSEYIYNILYTYDEDFRKLFKIKADFDSEMDYNQDNLYKMIQFISSFCKKKMHCRFPRMPLRR